MSLYIFQPPAEKGHKRKSAFVSDDAKQARNVPRQVSHKGMPNICLQQIVIAAVLT